MTINHQALPGRNLQEAASRHSHAAGRQHLVRHKPLQVAGALTVERGGKTASSTPKDVVMKPLDWPSSTSAFVDGSVEVDTSRPRVGSAQQAGRSGQAPAYEGVAPSCALACCFTLMLVD